MNEQQEGLIHVETEGDIVTVRRTIRDVAKALGFGITDVTRIVTAASELTRNIYVYANEGNVRWRIVNSGYERGLELVFEDQGPGISDLALAQEEGYSTGGGLGLGLPGARRLMDEMEIESEVGQGTTVTLRKWLRR